MNSIQHDRLIRLGFTYTENKAISPLPCNDCNIDTRFINEYYMVNDDVWLKAVPGKKGILCIGCLEHRLGRELKPRDFSEKLDLSVNKAGRQSIRLSLKMGLNE